MKCIMGLALVFLMRVAKISERNLAKCAATYVLAQVCNGLNLASEQKA